MLLRRSAVLLLALLPCAGRIGRRPGRADGKRRARNLADRQHRERWKLAESRSMSPARTPKPQALHRLADRPTRGLQGALGQDEQPPDFAGAQLARSDPGRAGQLDRGRTGADRPQPLYRDAGRTVRPRPRRRAAGCGGRGPPIRANAADPGDDHRAARRPASSCAIPGSGPGRSFAPRKARSIMFGSAGSGSIRCWSMPRKPDGRDAAGGATCSIFTAPPTF